MIANRLKAWLNDSRRLDARRALLHPAFVVAVFVLVVNDHVLKHGAWAGDFTGKLSDFVGLFFAPVLLAALFAVKTRHGLAVSGLATAAVFTAINTSPAAAAAFDGVVSLVFPFHTTVDPTDLVALVAIVAGIVVLEPVMSTTLTPLRRLLEYAALTGAGLASIATSPSPCGGDSDCTFEEPGRQAQVSILNKTNELHELRIRALQFGVELDCERVAEDPAAYLHEALFDPPITWLVQSGQEIPVGAFSPSDWGVAQEPPPGACRAALVETDHAPPIVVFWDADLPVKSFPFDADVPPDIPADPQTIVLAADYDDVDPDDMHPWRNRSSCGDRADLCSLDVLAPLAEVPDGARYEWRSNDEPKLHFPRSTGDDGEPSPIPEGCQLADPADVLLWEDLPLADQDVVGLEEGLDGCHELQLIPATATAPAEPQDWWVCAPFEQLAPLAPQADGTTSRIVALEVGEDSGSPTSLKIDVTVQTDDLQVDPFRTIYLVRGSNLPSAVELDFSVTPREGCAPVETACGQTVLAADVSAANFEGLLTPGEVYSFEAPATDVQVVRAEYLVTRNDACDVPNTADGSPEYFEAVIVVHD